MRAAARWARRLGWGVRYALGRRPRSDREAVLHLARLAARLPRHEPGEAKLPFGVLRFVDALSLRWQYEEIVVEGRYDFTSAGPTPRIVDCGANIGLSVHRFKSLYPASTVVALEADSTIAEVLRENVRRLGLDKVQVVGAAAWIEDGVVGFQRDGGDSGRVEESGAQIPAVRLASLIDEPVDLLKLDIEGAEFEVVRDLARSGALAHVRRLVCEVHGGEGDGHLDELLTTLRTSGMVCSVGSARSAPDLPGRSAPTPFAAQVDGRYLLQLYAWREEVDPCAS